MSNIPVPNTTQSTNRYVRLIEELVEPVPEVSQDVLVNLVKDIVGEEDPINAVVVVDDGKPTGLVMSLHLDRTLSHQYGVSLFSGQPVTKVMDKEFLSVEYNIPVEDVARLAMSRNKHKLYDHVVVTENGRLQGIVGVWKILDFLSSIYQQRTLELTSVNRQLQQGIRQRKLAARALRQAKDEAEAANRAKGDFLARMSHEIRTPMNAILGMAELLHETKLTKEQKDYVDTFSSSGELLLGIINDILDFSKIEAGQIVLESIPYNLSELVEDSAKIMAFRAHEKGLELICQISAECHPHVLGDPTRLRQIIINLVGNAIKFTHEGEVVIKVSPEDEEGWLHFEIKDTGIGIPASKIDTIFDSFSQADTSTTRKYGGTGLGLAICQKLVELMGGRIWVESRNRQGTKFHFSVRLEKSAPQETKQADLSVLKGLPVLVVDDNATNRLIFSEHLTRWGAIVTQAESGADAIIAFEKAAKANQPFKLALLDCNMPKMNGFQLAESIQNKYEAPPTLMMFSSNDRGEDKIKASDLGMAQHLVKPVKQTEMQAAILAALGKAGLARSRVHSTPVEESKLPPMRILLAEDYKPNAKIVHLFLKNTPIRIETVENGQLAVEAFLANTYDLVLMDMEMPVMDGMTATRTIRSWERENNRPETPIVALTAHAFEEHKRMFMDAGCSHFIHKPLKKITLLETLRNYARVIDEVEAEDPEVKKTRPIEAPPLGKKGTAPVIAIDEDLMDLVDDYLNAVKSDCLKSVQALKKSDFATIFSVGRDLKGSGAVYGLAQISDFGEKIHKMAEARNTRGVFSNIKALYSFIKEVQIVPQAPEAKSAPLPSIESANAEEESGRCFSVKVGEDLADIIDFYIDALKTDCIRLGEALTEGDFNAVYGVAHDLKGSGAGYGLELISEIGGEICKMIKSEEYTAISQQYIRLKDYVSNVRISIH